MNLINKLEHFIRLSKIQYAICCSLMLLIVGCNSNTVPEGMDLHFATRIIENKLKQFEIKLVRNQILTNKIDTRKLIKDNRQHHFTQSQEAISRDKILYKVLVSQLEQKLETIQFCREGYWLIKEDIYALSPTLKGECYDSATEEDIAKFPSTIKTW